MKKLSYLTLSIVLHGGALSLLFYFSVKTPSLEPIPLELVFSKPDEASKDQKFLKPASQVSSSDSDTVKDKELAKKILASSGVSLRTSSPGTSSTFSAELNDRQFYNDSNDNVFGKNDNWAFHQQVYLNVDSELIFDAMLARFDHFGSVYLEFAVDGKGHLLENSLKASADDAILKVHAVRALRRALHKDFENTKWSVLDKPVVFRAKFEFTKEDPNINFKKQKGFSDPVFVFRRATMGADVASFKVKDEGFDNLGDYFDPEEVARKLKNRKANKVLKAGQYDPFESYRVDPAYRL